MRFETKKDVLDWVEKQPRVLTKEFIGKIPWEDVKKYPIDKTFIPVLMYMRDIEILTEMYHNELLRTPTGRDKVIGKFMERWGVEEITHGEVLNRFLMEAGVEIGDSWKDDIFGKYLVELSFVYESFNHDDKLCWEEFYSRSYGIWDDKRTFNNSRVSTTD